LQVLAKHKILSAPIVVSAGLEDVENMVPGESAPSLLGWLDVMDVITCFLAYLREHKKELPTAMLALMAELDKYGPQFISKMLITIVGEQALSQRAGGSSLCSSSLCTASSSSVTADLSKSHARMMHGRPAQCATPAWCPAHFVT
jgi:hypothetical protein